METRTAPLLLCCTVTLALAAAPSALSQTVGKLHELKIDGRADDIELIDVDGDGHRDIVVSHHEGARRFLTWFQLSGSGFVSHFVPVPPEATVGVIADLLPAPGPEVIFLESRRLVAQSLRSPAGQLQVLGERQFFFDAPSKQLPLADLAADLDGDGRSDLMVPTPEGYELYLARDLTHPVQLPGIVRQHVSQEYASDHFLDLDRTLPKLALTDITGDGASELLYFLEGTLGIYERGTGQAPTTLREEPATIFGDGIEAKKDDSISRRRLIVADIDGDRRADIVSSTNSGNITQLGSWGTRVAVFLTKGDGKPAEKPDSVVKVKGVSIAPRLVDHDGDGDLDLILSTIRIDLATGISAATLKKLTVSYEVYAWEGRAYSTRPTVQRDIEVPLDGGDMGGDRILPFGYLHGDYDGDGKKDFLTVGDGQFEIYRGGVKSGGWLSKDDGFAAQPTWTIRAEVTNDVHITDMDSDGKSEVIFLGKGKLVVWRPEGLR